MITYSFLLIVLTVHVAPVTPNNERLFVAKRWEKASLTFDKLLWSQTDAYIDILNSIVHNHNHTVSQQCRHSLRLLSDGLTHRKLWALKCKPSSFIDF